MVMGKHLFNNKIDMEKELLAEYLGLHNSKTLARYWGNYKNEKNIVYLIIYFIRM